MAAAVTGAWLLAGASPTTQDAGTIPKNDRAAAASHPSPAAPPRSLDVPGHFSAPVQAVGSDGNGTLRLPKSPHRLGWWVMGARPGAAHGTVLLAGHVDSRNEGLGTFAKLRDVPLGARVSVTDADGTRHHYKITARRTYRKDGLPHDLFTATGSPRLALVTCTGPYIPSAGGYQDNLVLYGKPDQRP